MSSKHLRRQASILVVLVGLALIVALGLSLAPVYAADREVGAGKTHATIQAAVNAAQPGDVILVYPGTYNESVDLSGMNPDGNLILRTVNNAGVPTSGTATVSAPTEEAFHTTAIFGGNLTIEGFVVEAADDDGIEIWVDGDVVVRNVTANGTDDDGIQVGPATGNVTIEDCIANQNQDDGIDIDYVDGDVTVSGCTTNENGQSNDPAEDGDGVEIGDDDAVDGKLTMTNHTSDRNRGDGIDIRHVAGLVSLTSCQTNQNHDDGVDIDFIPGSVVLVDLVMNDNGDGDGGEAGLEVGEDDGVTGYVTVDSCTANDNDEDGLGVTQVGGVVSITHGTANRNGWGIWVADSASQVFIEHGEAISNANQGIWVTGIDGGVVLDNGTANENGDNGYQVESSGDVTVTACIGNNNEDNGIEVDADGKIWVTDFHADGNLDDGIDLDAVGDVTISNATSSNNGPGVPVPWAEGFYLGSNGNVMVTNCTARGNANDGFTTQVDGDSTFLNSVAQGNGDDGIDVDGADGQGSVQKGGLICENFVGLGIYKDRNADAEANWWGAASGPTHPSNAGGSGDEIWDGTNKASGTVDYTPWLDTLDASVTVDPVNAYEPTQVSFQISGGGGTAFMGLGPGDLGGTPPFTVTTDNGVLTAADDLGATIHAFVNQPDGVLAVTLTPSKTGTATVTLEGPCGLDAQIAILVEPAIPGKPMVFLPVVLKKR